MGTDSTPGTALQFTLKDGYQNVAMATQKSAVYPQTGNAANGFTTTVPDGITLFKVNAAALLLAATIIMPANPNDGQPLTISAPRGITALTLTPNTGQAFAPNFLPVAIGAGASIRAKWSAIDSTWNPN